MLSQSTQFSVQVPRSIVWAALALCAGCNYSDNDSDPGDKSFTVGRVESGLATGDTKWVELGVVLDQEFISYFPDLATAKAQALATVVKADELYRMANFDPAIRISTVRLVALTDGSAFTNPGRGDLGMREQLAAWAQDRFSADIDAWHLMSGQDFGHTGGVSYPNTICTSSAVSVSYLKSGPFFARDGGILTAEYIGRHARTIAHEVGHNFGLRHDGTDITRFCPDDRCTQEYVDFAHTTQCPNETSIMGSRSAGSDFSECSRYQVNVIFNQGIPGQTGGNAPIPTCLDDEPAPPCDADPNAECALADPCCSPDCRIVAADTQTVCRVPAHPECDVPDICTGASAQCTSSVLYPAGKPCLDDYNHRGACLNGTCLTRDGICDRVSEWLEVNSSATATVCTPEGETNACGAPYCEITLGTQSACRPVCNPGTGFELCSGGSTVSADGFTCGPDQQCLREQCVSSSDIVQSTAERGAGGADGTASGGNETAPGGAPLTASGGSATARGGAPLSASGGNATARGGAPLSASGGNATARGGAPLSASGGNATARGDTGPNANAEPDELETNASGGAGGSDENSGIPTAGDSSKSDADGHRDHHESTNDNVIPSNDETKASGEEDKEPGALTSPDTRGGCEAAPGPSSPLSWLLFLVGGVVLRSRTGQHRAHFTPDAHRTL